MGDIPKAWQKVYQTYSDIAVAHGSPPWSKAWIEEQLNALDAYGVFADFPDKEHIREYFQDGFFPDVFYYPRVEEIIQHLDNDGFFPNTIACFCKENELSPQIGILLKTQGVCELFDIVEMNDGMWKKQLKTIPFKDAKERGDFCQYLKEETGLDSGE